MWLSNRLNLINRHPGPIILACEAAFGTQQLLGALKDSAPTPLWLEFGSSVLEDEVAQGNLLAEGVQKTLGNPLFEYSLPYSYGLKILDLHLELLGPFMFLLSNAEYAPEFAAALLTLNRSGSRVVLAFSRLPETFALPDTALVLSEDDLRLSRAEALELAAGNLSAAEVDELLRHSDGAFEAFATRLHGRLHLPTPLRPGPDGPRLPDGHEVEVDPNTLLQVLIKREKWLEALELAVAALPERIPEHSQRSRAHLPRARLAQAPVGTLGGSTRSIFHTEDVLFWRLSAGGWLGRAESIRATW